MTDYCIWKKFIIKEDEITIQRAKNYTDLFSDHIDPDYVKAIQDLNKEFPAGQVALIESVYKEQTNLFDNKGKQILVGDIFSVDGKRFHNLGGAHKYIENKGGLYEYVV
jgi:hypothetical protein